MFWMFLSPHLDDVVLSCGGLIAELVKSGQSVAVWTICAGDPPPEPFSPLALELHLRWGYGTDAAARRREEDRQSCQRLGAIVKHFSIPDCIYRRDPISGEPLISTNDALFQPLPEVEYPLADSITRQLKALLPKDVRLVSPLTLGGHIDHHLTRRAAESLNQPLWYYSDYPYAASDPEAMKAVIKPDWTTFTQSISDLAFIDWVDAVKYHQSQISTFWGSTNDMEHAIRSYWQAGGGSCLWGSPGSVKP